MTFLPAGFIDGSRVTGEMLRRAMWIATRGVHGTATADSFKVTQLATPGSAVLVAPGGGAVTTLFAGAPSIQTYTVANDATVTLPIPANSSGSPVSWQVIIRVRDPQYAGESVPGAPLTDTYTTLEAVSALPTDKPYLWLATVTLPASTATVTNAMITDRRVLALAKSQREPVRILQPQTNNNMSYSTTVYQNWPQELVNSNPIYHQTYTSPKWASAAVVKVSVAGIYATGTAPAYGGIRLMFNGTPTNHAIVYSEGVPNRVTVLGAWNLLIPSNLRGTTLAFDLQGTCSSGADDTLRADFQTQLIWEVEWQETI